MKLNKNEKIQRTNHPINQLNIAAGSPATGNKGW